jgi:hypothetical protein
MQEHAKAGGTVKKRWKKNVSKFFFLKKRMPFL